MLSRKLPSELEEEILTRLPPLSLTRFKAVCKQWNALFNDKIFISNHFACAQARPEFLLRTGSKIYSISVNLNDDDPNIKVRKLPFDIPGLESHEHLDMVGYNGHVLLRDIYNKAAVWNPWLRQSRLIKVEHKPFRFCGIGYDSTSPERSYKIVGYTTFGNQIPPRRRIVIYELATNAWKYIDPQLTENFIKEGSLNYNSVSLNGNLYWIAYDLQTRQYFIGILDCSKEIMKSFCILPSKNGSPCLAIFKRDRFSLLEECNRTSKIEIWVTKKKITNGDDVVWISFMSVSIPNVPMLYDFYNRTSYLVDDNIYGKSLVLCDGDKTKQACVYIVRGDKCKKIKIDNVVGKLLCFTVYVPSLIPIP